MDTVAPSYPSMERLYVFDNSNSSSTVTKMFLPSSLSAETTVYAVPSLSVSCIFDARLSDGRDNVAYISLLDVPEKYASAITGL